MDDRSRRSSEQPPSGFRASIDLAYATAEDVLRDRLADATRGLIARFDAPLSIGDAVGVRIEITRQRLHVSARGLVRWATPLARGTLVVIDHEGAGHRDEVILDVLFGVRTTGSETESAPDGAPPLSVAMLQRNGVLRQVFQLALERFAREKAGGAALRLDAAGDVPTFVASISARHPDLAIIDCDGVESQTDPILDAVRSNGSTRRTPVILLSSTRSPCAGDRFTVTMHKPVAMKAFLNTTDLLLRS